MSGADRITEGRLALGSFIRSQRNLANLSLRELARRTELSNPYLSQLERGLHEPSVRVLKALAGALNVSAETLLAQAGLLEDRSEEPAESAAVAVETAVRADPYLTNGQKQALLAVYRSYLAESTHGGQDPSEARPPATTSRSSAGRSRSGGRAGTGD
jgi:transcriptional regulator with XRE-family HTH domain